MYGQGLLLRFPHAVLGMVFTYYDSKDYSGPDLHPLTTITHNDIKVILHIIGNIKYACVNA